MSEFWDAIVSDDVLCEFVALVGYCSSDHCLVRVRDMNEAVKSSNEAPGGSYVSYV